MSDVRQCCENEIADEDRNAEHVDQCPDCGADVDAQGWCIEPDDCGYSPEVCSTCGYCPCDGSC